jgi:hypothetical protein
MNFEKINRKFEMQNIQIYLRKISDRYKIPISNLEELLVIPSNLQTKNWRKSTEWYKTGKQNECEKFQVSKMEFLLGKKLVKTNHRLQKLTGKILTVENVRTRKDAFEYTENFDRKCEFDECTVYFNFKFVCDSGGSQTRTCECLYEFIRAQTRCKNKFVKFVNILDGDGCYRNINQLRYLAKDFSNIFVGDTYEFTKNPI